MGGESALIRAGKSSHKQRATRIPDMTIIREHTIAANSGWGTRMDRGQTLRLTATGPLSLVCFNAADLTERFDQARTKVYNMRLWITAGEQLFSKLNNPLMTMASDGFAGLGRHDLQYGMCGAAVLAQASRAGTPQRYAHLRGKPVPDHGCLENLTAALRPWSIEAAHIPMPLTLFQHTEIDTASGAIHPVPTHPAEPVSVELRAEMDLVVAVSTCPALEARPGPGTATAELA